MRFNLPVSCGSFVVRFSAFDVLWAVVTPLLALWIRNGVLLNSLISWQTVAVFWLITFFASLLAFLVFRIRDGMTHLFSVHDALDVAKAVLSAELLTCLALFSLTRLDGIPRSTPLIHALILFVGLVSARTIMQMIQSQRELPTPTTRSEIEHIIVIGSNRLSAFYINFLHAYARGCRRVIGVLDERNEMIGRSVAGVRVLGPVTDLLPLIKEYKEHGIHIERVIVGGDSDFLTEEVMSEISSVCSEYEIKLDRVPELVGLASVRTPVVENQIEPVAEPVPINVLPSSYFQSKRYFDFCLGLVLVVLFLPLYLIVAVVVLLDVGSPMLFWQRRVGIHGQGFRIYKFRTLKPAYDNQGDPTVERMSWVGGLLRKFRLDELPQLLNVLVGDMSVIGPRPLLPHDQPSQSTLRLMVRPGITGWAQVNGGKLITPEEKNALDEWYVRNASLWLDLVIICKTVAFMMIGEHRFAQRATATAATPVTPIQPAE